MAKIVKRNNVANKIVYLPCRGSGFITAKSISKADDLTSVGFLILIPYLSPQHFSSIYVKSPTEPGLFILLYPEHL